MGYQLQYSIITFNKRSLLEAVCTKVCAVCYDPMKNSNAYFIDSLKPDAFITNAAQHCI